MMQATRDVGGDFYDVIPLSGEQVILHSIRWSVLPLKNI